MQTTKFNVMLRLIISLLALGIAAHAELPQQVLVFGDSITAGGALPKEQRDQLWVTLVEKQSAGALKLINEGKGGRPTQSVKEFEAVVKAHSQVDALIIALGMNDSRDITDACVQKAVTNLKAMIAVARQSYGEKLPVLLVGPSNINKTALGPTKPIADQREAKLRDLGRAFAELATETDCDFISLFGIVPAESLLKDGVHPDGPGNEVIAAVIGKKLRLWLNLDP